MPNNNLTAGIQCQELPGPGGPPPLPGVTRNRFAKYPGLPGVGISRIISRGQHWAGTCPDIGVTILGDIVPVTVTWHSLPPAGRVSPTRQQQDCTTSTVQCSVQQSLPSPAAVTSQGMGSCSMMDAAVDAADRAGCSVYGPGTAAIISLPTAHHLPAPLLPGPG